MNIVDINLQELIPYANNPRRNDAAVNPVAESIKRFGFKVPIVIDKNKTIICGHTRYKAAKRLGMKSVPCVVADDLSETQIKAFRLVDNRTSEFSEWDNDWLNVELDELINANYDLEPFDFDFSMIFNKSEITYDKANPDDLSLSDRFIIPPFSVFDARQGQWQRRKQVWHEFIHSGEGRDTGLLDSGLEELAKRTNSHLTGTSIFDPVLCEVLYNWFCPGGGKVIDPFAGGSVRGLVGAFVGINYTGIDLSRRQIDANYKQFEELGGARDLYGKPLGKPNWINGDSMNIDSLVDCDDFDFMLTCPPYADLEVYSDDPRDLSNMSYQNFLTAYRNILKKTTAKLKDNAYAAIVVGEVRDKNGYYYNFVGDTIQAMLESGLKYYNECILITALATAAVRAGRQFGASRKVVKTHQNVLIFIKGDERKLRDKLKIYDYDFPEMAE